MIFVGASPVLEEEIADLKSNKKKYFILASDTSCYYLIKNNVVPDAILSIDSGRGTSYHFREDIGDEIPIFTWLGGNKEIFYRKNPIYLLLSTYPLDQLLSNFLEESLIFKNPSLNISGMAMSIAENMEILDFGFSGTSFSSYNCKSHCRGTGYESYMIPNINRLKTLEMYSPGNYKSVISKKNQIASNSLTNSKYNYKKFYDVKPSLKNNFQLNNSLRIKKDLNYFYKILNQENIIEQVSSEIQLPLKLITNHLKNFLIRQR